MVFVLCSLKHLEKIKLKLKQDFIPDNAKCSTHNSFDNGHAVGITIHWTGPFPGQTPEQVRQWWIDSKGEASAHFIIKDEEVLQCWPLDRVAWHAGCRPGNYQTIGIEVIPMNKEGEFSAMSINSLNELIKYLNKELGMTAPIVRHFDWTGKRCPEYYCDTNRWKQLLKEITV